MAVSRGVYLVPGGCTWSGGGSTWSGGVGGVPGPGGVPDLGVYLVWGCTWSGGCTWSRGGRTWSGGVPGLEGVPGPGGVYLVWGGEPGRGEPGPRGVYLVRGGVPGPGGCTWSGTPPLWTGTPCKNITFATSLRTVKTFVWDPDLAI